jgi:hypothetical protein
MKLWHATAIGGCIILFLGTGGADRFKKSQTEHTPPDYTANSGTNNGIGGNSSPSPQQSPNPENLPPGSLSESIANRVGESTAGVPGTNGGDVACAWVVNDVYKNATGQYITDLTGGSNLSVADTIAAMNANPTAFTQVTRAEAIASGQDYIIASNGVIGSNGSHIGIANGTTVWSNSSSKAEISQNYTVDSWNNHFGATSYYIIKKKS